MSLPRIVQAVNARVSLAGDESISDVKTYTDSPVVPDVVETDFSQKASNTKFVKTVVRKAVDELQKQINELEGTVLTATEDSTTAYEKPIPTSANLFKYAAIRNFGGRSIVWNQYAKNNNPPSARNSLTFTYDSATESVTIDGTASADTNATGWWGLNYSSNSALKSTFGHKIYAYAKILSGSVTGTANFKLMGMGLPSILGASTVYTNTRDPSVNNEVLNFECTTGTVFNSLKVQVLFIDLTLALGSGNEPSTAGDFEAIFPNDLPAFNAGEIKSAGVNKIVSRGKNLINDDEFFGIVPNTEKLVDGSWSTKTGSLSPRYFMGDYSNNRSPVFRDANLTLSFDVKLNNDTTSEFFYGFVKSDGTDTQNSLSLPSGWVHCSISLVSNTQAVKIGFTYGSNRNILIKNFMLEASATETAYVPYMNPVNADIPAEILALPGYGWSAGSVFNEIDWENKKYIQRVGQADLGLFPWTYDSSTRRFITGISAAKNVASWNGCGLVCERYVAARVGSDAQDDQVIGIYSSVMYIRDTRFTDPAALAQSLSGVMIHFGIDTPIETDISALIDDNTIEVESGGSLTFENSNGDDYRIPVPSSLVTMEKP